MNRPGLLFVLLALAANAPADEWHFEMADEAHWVGWRNTLVLDSSGFPHAAYYDADNDSLKYAHWDGSQWWVEVVDDWDGNYIGGIGIAVDSADRPRIAYRAPYDHGAVWYARWDGSEWRIELVDSDPERGIGTDISLELDSLDRPHIAYTADSGGFVVKLKYARWDGSAWRIETIEDTGNTGCYCSLELDSGDLPHIAYCDMCFDALKYASWDGSAWQIETVESGGSVGRCTSLELDSDDYPHIASVTTHPNDENDLKYAYWDGSRWRFDIVAAGGDHGYCVSMALDSARRPHITFFDWPTHHVKHAFWDGAYWQIEDLERMISFYSCIAVDGEDQPHISCYSYPSPMGLGYLRHEGEFGVEAAELAARPADGGILIGWSITGDVPAGLRVLRSAGGEEPVDVSGALPGLATRWLDRTAYDASGKGLKPLVYWLEVTESDGTTSRFGPTEAVRVELEGRVLSLSDPYPSPASDAVTIGFTLSEDGRVELSVYDLSGRRVATPVAGELTAGRHEVGWDCAEVPSGVYLYRLTTDSGSVTRRLVVSR
jgi:hypothetical protein